MMILKAQKFEGILTPAKELAEFVNKNNIKREDILSITAVDAPNSSLIYTIFFYSDSETQILTKGVFGWS